MSYKTLFHALDEAAIISETSPQGLITFANHKFCQISGYAISELLGNSHRIINSGFHPKEFFTEMWKTIKSGQNWHGEICNKNKQGELYWVSSTIVPVTDDITKEIVKYVSVRFDITQRKKIEQQLKWSDARYKIAIESSLDGFWVFDLQGHLLQVNDSYCKMTGYTREELLNTNLDLSNKYDNRQFIKKYLDDFFQQHKTHFETSHFCKNGAALNLEITLSYNEQEHCIFAFLRNLTERIHNEQERLQLQRQLWNSQRLESLGQLTAGIAHDFNNVLASILGYNEISFMVAEEIEQPDTKNELNQSLEQIKIAAERATDLIRKMMIYCNQSKVTLSDNNIQALCPFLLIHEVSKMLRSIFPSNISIDLLFDEKQEFIIIIEPTELHQVITNLFVNARDAIGFCIGTIAIDVKTETFYNTFCNACGHEIEGQFVQISVTDTGSGISEENLLRIFDPFFTTKNVGKGTGLGLSVTSGIMHKFAGHILVESELNKGTTFHLLFPLIIDKNIVNATSIELSEKLLSLKT